jgi:penicillin-insensitive murein endopeptidase
MQRMLGGLVAAGLVAFLGTVLLPAADAQGKAAATLTWSDVMPPSDGPAKAIGGYSAGCVQGAAELPLTGAGYRVMKPERRRMFGHTRLVDFVRQLGSKIEQGGLDPLGVGDLGQARGGPAPSGHASHQNGLDADLWFSPAVEGAKDAPSMVEGNKPSARWSERVPKLLQFAVSDARVDRIFVNPVIKQALCASVPAAERGWLRKLRPWWGHDAHFHVRLACPEDSPECAPQPPLPAGDGCAEVEWWLSEASARERKEKAGDYQKRVGARPDLPATCSTLLK